MCGDELGRGAGRACAAERLGWSSVSSVEMAGGS